MGYRSNVEIIVYGDPETYDAFMASMKLLDHRVFKDWENMSDATFEYFQWKNYNQNKETKLMSFSVLDVKWYEDYPDVEAWEKDFIPKAEEAGLNWEMVRVGEESDDITHECGGDDVDYLLYTSTSIERNF